MGKTVNYIFILLCLASCGQRETEIPATNNYSWVNSIKNKPVPLSKNPEQFECGTSNLNYFTNRLDEWEDSHKGKIKSISFLKDKRNIAKFLNLLEKYSFELTSFDVNVLNNFYLPAKTDHIWFAVPLEQFCFIKENNSESTPIRIAFSLGKKNNIIFELSSDSTIVNKLSNIMIAENL